MLSTTQIKSPDNKMSNSSLAPSGFSDMFSSRTGKHINGETIKHNSPTHRSPPPNLTISKNSNSNSNDERPLSSPGPGDYDVTSPYNSKLPPSISSPTLRSSSPAYNIFPTNDNPAPNTYDVINGDKLVKSAKFANSSRKTFLDEIISKPQSPGPGEHHRDRIQHEKDKHSNWSKSENREIFLLSESPGAGGYMPNNSIGSQSRGHSRGQETVIKDDRMFSNIVKTSSQLPGVGDYDLASKSNYNHHLTSNVKSPVPYSGSSSTYDIFGSFIDNDIPGPNAYQVPCESRSIGTPKFNSNGQRTTFIDDSLRENVHSPGPGKYSPNNSLQGSLSGEWRAKTSFELFGKPPQSPSPDAYEPSFTMTEPKSRQSDFSTNLRGNYIEDNIKDCKFKMAPGTYSEQMPPLFKRDAPKIQKRFKTKEIIPSERGANKDVVLRIASNEVTGGFRKMSMKEVYDGYKNRLKHTKDCVKAYASPSTLTIIASASENVYANPAGEGRWRTIPTGGAVRIKGNKTVSLEDEISPPPLSRKNARKRYEQSCRLGHRNKKVQNFVKDAISKPKEKSHLSKYEQVETRIKLKQIESPPLIDGLAKVSLRILMEKRTRERMCKEGPS